MKTVLQEKIDDIIKSYHGNLYPVLEIIISRKKWNTEDLLNKLIVELIK